jgi:hypothetical protein
MRVELDQIVRLLLDDSRELEAPLSVTRGADLDIVRAELENPDPHGDDALVETDRDVSNSLTVLVEWYQNLAGAEWQWS